MNPIKHHPFAPFQQDDFAGGRSFSAEQSRVASLSVSQSTAVTLTTEEGDRVTLNLSKASQIDAGTYRGIAMGSGSVAASEAGFLGQGHGQLGTVEIEGDLSDEEWAEIEAAVAVIDGMMDDFLSGDFAGMIEDAEVLKELDTIDSLQAAFSYERQVVYAQQDHMAAQNEGTARGHGRGGPHLQGLMRRMDHLTDEMAGKVQDFEGRRDALLKSIDTLLERFRDKWSDKGVEADESTKGDLALSVIETVQSAFLLKTEAYGQWQSAASSAEA